MPSIKSLALLTILLLFVAYSAKAQEFYKTPSGTKYHTSGCHTVKNVSEKITLSQAKEMGLEPCKICKPQTASSKVLPVKKAQGESATTQCKGTTKAGNRCRHMTRIANGYCFQHQPG